MNFILVDLLLYYSVRKYSCGHRNGHHLPYFRLKHQKQENLVTNLITKHIFATCY